MRRQVAWIDLLPKACFSMRSTFELTAMYSTRVIAIVLVSLATIAGCDSSDPLKRPTGVPVSGKILLPSGAPLTGGTLILRPEASLYGATAIIQSDGSFTLQDPVGKSDVVPGKYQVFVSFPNPSHAALAANVKRRYQESGDSDSDIIVDLQQATNDLTIRLKR